jgi:hypothetical protein
MERIGDLLNELSRSAEYNPRTGTIAGSGTSGTTTAADMTAAHSR